MKKPGAEKPSRKPGRWGKRCRTCARVLRVGILLAVFLVVSAGAYLDLVGLPDFAKGPLVEKLRARGIDIEFSRLRLSWTRGLVAESVRLGPSSGGEFGPRLYAREAEVSLNRGGPAWFDVGVDSLTLQGGGFSWQLAGTNQARQSLAVNDIQARLRLLPGDQWRLDNLSAEFRGGRIHVSGAITNASAFQDWKAFRSGAGMGPGPAGNDFANERLREAIDTIRRIKFAAPPNLEVVFYGNAGDVETFHGQATLRAPGAVTPWGSLTNGLLLARLEGRQGTNSPPEAVVELMADSAATRWGQTTHFQLRAHVVPDEGSTNLVRANIIILADKLTTEWTTANHVQLTADLTRFPLSAVGAGDGGTNVTRARLTILADSLETEWVRGTNVQVTAEWARAPEAPAGVANAPTNLARAKMSVRVDGLTTEWANAASVQLTADWSHSLTNIVPVAGMAELSITNAGSQWANAAHLQLGARFDPAPTNSAVTAEESWGQWAVLAPYMFNWDCRLDGIQAEEFQLAGLLFGGNWRAPDLTITNLHAEMYDGKVDLNAGLNVATRALSFGGSEDFDVQKIGPALGEGGRKWLQQYSWQRPPQARAEGGLTLPAWNHPHWKWDADIDPSLWLRGDFAADVCSYHGITVLSVKSHFSRTNRLWDLPDLVAIRPEGRLELAHWSDDRTRDFYFHVHSTVDLKAARDLLDDDARKTFDELVLSRPPEIDAEIWGRWHEGEKTGIRARVAVTNFAFRGESADRFSGTVEFTNQFIRLFNGRIDRADTYARADAVMVDIGTQMLYLTNGSGNMDVMVMGHMLGPVVTRDFAPYHFLKPPAVRGYGAIPLLAHHPADAHFQIDGGPFRWMNFNAGHVSGKLDWVGEILSVTNLDADFYRGKLSGNASFDFSIPGDGAALATEITIREADVAALLGDLSSHTNKLEGNLSGHLNFLRGDTSDPRTWIGSGDVSLRDGFIWSIPIFGRFSKMLNAVRPGLGESRASQAAATFIITNYTIFSKDLQILAPTMGMNYRGTVDFDENVNAIVEAKLLREAPLLGPLLSVVLAPLTKIFEYKVTGTLDDPIMAQRFKLVTPLIHPINTLKEILPGEPLTTNAPPVKKGP